MVMAVDGMHVDGVDPRIMHADAVESRHEHQLGPQQTKRTWVLIRSRGVHVKTSSPGSGLANPRVAANLVVAPPAAKGGRHV